MLAALDWNKKHEGVKKKKMVVVWSNRRNAYVLKKKSEKASDMSHIFQMMDRAYQVHEEQLQLPPIAPPVPLKPRGSHMRKPTKEELLEARKGNI